MTPEINKIVLANGGYMARIALIVRADSSGEACDGVSEMLRSAEANGFVVDWQYVSDEGEDTELPGSRTPWRKITIPPNYTEGDAFNT